MKSYIKCCVFRSIEGAIGSVFLLSCANLTISLCTPRLFSIERPSPVLDWSPPANENQSEKAHGSPHLTPRRH